MNKLLKNYLILLFMIIYFTAGFSGERPPSNQKLAEQFFISKTVAVVDSFVDTCGIVVHIPNSDPFSRWLKRSLIDQFMAQNMTVFEKNVEQTSPNFVLNISSPEFLVGYKLIARRLLLFPREYQRIVKAAYHLKLTGRTGRVLFSQQMTETYTDTLSSGEVKHVENSQLPFTRGAKIESKTFKRWLEPLLVTASTVTVVYLFFTLRSGR